MAFLSIVVAFAARALLIMLFLPFSALDKVCVPKTRSELMT